MSFEDFQWTIETQYRKTLNGIQIYAPAGTDYFVNPIDGKSKSDAPFFYKEVEGDFILRAKVSHDFVSTYDACVLLALDNDNLWAKACFEYTDFEKHAVVTVMTNQKSDDSNGVNIEGNDVWLQLARKENIFAIHYSLDGNKFTMSRLCSLPMQKKIKVGLVAQSPTGNGGTRKFADVSLVQQTLADIRAGK